MADNLKIVDLHTHILPKMDDGSDSIETSLAILHTLWNDGVDVVCATSHYYRERETVEEFVERRSRSAASLRKAIRKVTKEGQESMAGNGLPVFFAGAETAFFSGISECDRLNDLCLEGTRTLMLEMPFREWTGMEHGEWQGTVTFPVSGEQLPFRSLLELMRIVKRSMPMLNTKED